MSLIRDKDRVSLSTTDSANDNIERADLGQPVSHFSELAAKTQLAEGVVTPDEDLTVGLRRSRGVLFLHLLII